MPSVLSVVYFVFIVCTTLKCKTDPGPGGTGHAGRPTPARIRSLNPCAGCRKPPRLIGDMRHHIAMLQGMASEGQMEKIKNYLRAVRSDIEAITPVRFCENETVNLVLSTFYNKAIQMGVSMKVEARLPGFIPVSDTELCSLLSNGLENAVLAAAACPEPERRTVSVRTVIHRNNLLIFIKTHMKGK